VGGQYTDLFKESQQVGAVENLEYAFKPAGIIADIALCFGSRIGQVAASAAGHQQLASHTGVGIE
jgi:hypothetical protein